MGVYERLSRAGVVLAAACALLALLSGVWLVGGDDRLLDQAARRRVQGRSLRLEHHMAVGFERAAWAGLGVGVAGLATVGWWGRRRDDRSAGRVAGLGVGRGEAPLRWRWVMMVGICSMVVSGVLRAPRLGHSFWSDEAYAARVSVWGVNERGADGGWVHRPVDWSRALFFNERSNNHWWCTVEARVAHGVWRAWGRHPETRFSETALRMPSFVWGLLTVGAVTVLAGMVAGRGGLVCGLLLAVHPWHVRFAAEMRGYSAMLLALTLGLIFLLQASRDGRWRWWLLAGAMNLWAMLAFAGSVYVPLVSCGGLAALLAWRRQWPWLARLVLANALAAVVFLWLYGPSLSQLGEYLRRGTEVGAYRVSGAWLRQLGESLCLGVPWSVMSPAWREATWLSSAQAAGAAAVVVGGLAAVQMAATVWGRPRLLLIPGLLIVAGAVCIGQSVATGSVLLMWYLLPLVLAWVLVLGAGPANLAGRGACWHCGLQAVAVAVAVSVWTGNSLAMGAAPRQPMREAALEAGGRPRLQAVVGVSDQQMKLYAPEVRIVKSAADLDEAEEAAARQGQILCLGVCGWQAARERTPEVVARLEGGFYETVAELPGWEPMFSYRVLVRRP